MTAKFSPGPWAIHGSPGEPLFYVHGANKVCIMPEPSGYTQSPAEREANARLLAAAPELLEWLEWALDWAEKSHLECDLTSAFCTAEQYGDGAADQHQMILDARAVIAKANGQF